MSCVEMENWAFVSDIDVDVNVGNDGGCSFMACGLFSSRGAGWGYLSSRKALFDARKEAKMQKHH